MSLLMPAGGATVSKPDVTASTTYNDTNYEGLTNKTYSSAALGAADTNRLIVCAFGANNSRTISSATIGGVSATISVRHESTANDAWIGFFFAVVPTGTTGDIVVNTSGYMDLNSITAWRVMNANNSAISDSAADDDGTSLTDNITIQAGGAAMGAVIGAGSSQPSYVWTNLTEDYDTAIDANWTHGSASAAYATLQTEITITCAITNATSNRTMAIVAFQKA